MTTFAPIVAPTNDPNYLNYSKPIGDLPGDKSTGLLLSAFGEALESGAKVGDSIFKDVINNEVRQGVEKQRDAYTGALVAYTDMQAGAGVIPTPEGQAVAGIKAPSLTPDGEENLPAGVKSGVARAQSIGAAMTQNGGKQNDTLYTGALAALAKDMRNRYPGYKDYIDNKIAEVSGINPANAYMKNLLEDINRNGQSAKSEQEKAIALGRQYLGYDPHMPAYIEAVRNGLPNAVQNLESRINNVASKKIQFDELERVRKTVDWRKEDDAITQTAQFDKELRSKADLAWQGVVEIPGLNGPTTIQRLIDDSRAGRIVLNDEQHGALLQAATLARDTWNRQAVTIMRDRGYIQSIPKKQERDQVIADNQRFFDDQITAINNREYGTMFGNERRMKSMVSDTGAQILSDPDMGTYNRIQGAAKNIGGDAMVNYVQSEALKGGYVKNLQNFIQSEKLKSVSKMDPRFPQDTRSIYEAVKKAQDAKLPASTKVYDNLVQNVELIDLDTPPKGATAAQLQAAKKEVVNYMFDPAKNSKLMERFSKSFTDDQGVFHPGKEAIYDTLTKRSRVDSIWALKDNESWSKFKNTNEIWFRNLFGENLAAANDAMQSKQLDVKFKWDSDNKQLLAVYPKVTTGVEARYVDSIKENIAKLNKGLGNLAYMHDKEGTDTNDYIMEKMMELGFSPNDKLHGDILPQRVIEAIANSKKTDRIEDAFRGAKK